MNFSRDFSKPSFVLPLTPPEFRIALWNGLGRTAMHLRAHGDAGVEEILLEALSEELAFDAQIEGSRAPWLRNLLKQFPHSVTYPEPNGDKQFEYGDDEEVDVESSDSPTTKFVRPPSTLTFADVLEAIRTTERFFDWKLRYWTRTASTAEERAELFGMFHTETRPFALMALLGCFQSDERPLPEVDDRMLSLVEHEHEWVRTHALRALSHSSAPVVRDLALREIAKEQHPQLDEALELFRLHWNPGDCERIMRSLYLPEWPTEVHGITHSLRGLCESRSDDPAIIPLLHWVYEHAPCSHCRREAVIMLRDLQAVPDWMREEWRDDAGRLCDGAF